MACVVHGTKVVVDSEPKSISAKFSSLVWVTVSNNEREYDNLKIEQT